MDDVINASMAERVGDTHQSDEKNENPRPAEPQRLLPARDLLPETSHDEAGSCSDGNSDDDFNNKIDSHEDDRKPRFPKRKQPPSSYNGPTPK